MIAKLISWGLKGDRYIKNTGPSLISFESFLYRMRTTNCTQGKKILPLYCNVAYSSHRTISVHWAQYFMLNSAWLKAPVQFWFLGSERSFSNVSDKMNDYQFSVKFCLLCAGHLPARIIAPTIGQDLVNSVTTAHSKNHMHDGLVIS